MLFNAGAYITTNHYRLWRIKYSQIWPTALSILLSITLFGNNLSFKQSLLLDLDLMSSISSKSVTINLFFRDHVLVKVPWKKGLLIFQ
jgi:hypothetical protein